MRVLLTGATGFIGRHLIPVLRAEGHSVVAASRHPGATADVRSRGGARHTAGTPAVAGEEAPGLTWIDVDFSRDIDLTAWLPRLRGIDAVINAVGLFRERGAQTFQALHVDAPVALFDACVVAGVPRVLQISALGADAHAASAYHLSKHRADEHLSRLPLAWTIVQPSLIYGDDGTSARLFGTLATLPVIPLPGRGDQRLQPLHIDDVVAGIAAALRQPETAHQVVPFVGPRPLTLREYLADLRVAAGLGRARFISVPMPLVAAAARLGKLAPNSLLDDEALGMLLRGNTADPQPMRKLLGREPMQPRQFIAANGARETRARLELTWLLALLRYSIAAVWIFTGIVSFGLYPTESSFQLLDRTGIPRALAPVFLYSAATLDLVLGVLTLTLRKRQWLWLAQIALIAGYTLIITLRLPEYWLHPYGPVLKNLPMLAAIYLLYRQEKR